METGKAIYYLLKDSTDVGAICGDRIYPEIAQQDADAPFIAYTVIDTTPSGTKSSSSQLDTARCEIYMISDDYAEAMNLAIAVRAALDRQGGNIGPAGSTVAVQSIDFESSDIDHDQEHGVYIVEHTYNIRVQRTGVAPTVSLAPTNAITVEEVDGTPSGAANKLVFSNGTVTINGNTATITTGGSLTVKEVDGTPSDTATTLVFPNGTVSFDGSTATLDLSLDTLDTTGILEQIAVQLAADSNVSSSDFPNGLIGDFDQDGYVNVADLLIFFSLFGNGLSDTELSNRLSSAFAMADGTPFDAVRSLNSIRPDRDGDLNITTNDITESVDLYFTNARADARIAAALLSDLSDTPAGIGTAGQVLVVNATRTGYEFANQPTIPDHSIYVQTVNEIAPDQEGEVTLDTGDIAEGTNLYYTDARFDTRYATKTHYHGRYNSTASTERSGATANVEIYYTARPDGDGYAESATSDVGETDTINRTLYYSTKFQADPDTAGDWTQYTTQPADNATFATAKAALLAGLNDTDGTANTRGTLPLSLKMVRTVTAAATDLLLDTYTGAAAAYSVRKLDKDYTGYCMRVREDSGDTEADIGFDSNGDLDTAAIATHCGSASGYVVTWYNQADPGNYNFTQSTTSLQFRIYNGTSVDSINGVSALLGTSDGFRGGPPTGTADLSVFVVANVTSSGGLLGQQGNNGVFLVYQNGTTSSSYGGFSSVTYYIDGTEDTTQTRDSLYDALAVGSNHVLSFLASPSLDLAILLGYNAMPTLGHVGYVQEFIVYKSDQSTNRTGIESDITTYYSIT